MFYRLLYILDIFSLVSGIANWRILSVIFPLDNTESCFGFLLLQLFLRFLTCSSKIKTTTSIVFIYGIFNRIKVIWKWHLAKTRKYRQWNRIKNGLKLKQKKKVLKDRLQNQKCSYFKSILNLLYTKNHNRFNE